MVRTWWCIILVMKEFQRMIENDAFLEYARCNERCYRTPRQCVEENLGTPDL